MCGPEQTQRQKVAQPILMQNQPIQEQQANEYINAEVLELTELGSYQALEQNLQRLGPNPVAPNAQAQNENLSYKKRKKLEKERKERYKTVGKSNRLLSMEEVKNLSMFDTAESKEKWKQEKVPRSELTREQTMRAVLEENDYSNFENLDLVMRNVVASSALAKFIREYDVTEQSNPQLLCEMIKRRTEGVSGLLNPGLRLGLSLAQHTEGFSEKMKKLFLELDEAMSTAVMAETLKYKSKEKANADKQRVTEYFRNKGEADPEGKADRAVREHRAQQIQIAKRLMLMQLSDFKKIDNEGNATDWDKSMAVAISHCSRVVVTLPMQEDYNTQNSTAHHYDMWRKIMTIQGDNLAQDNKRGGSTHSVSRRKVSEGSGGSKEKKVIVNLIGQRGMNCAIGGIGNVGIGGKTLSNDGSCGHFYSMYKEADTKHYGTVLMGLESDANGVTNQMGHTHDMHATPEKASSLGGQRVDEVGKKYGGRQCDLTDFTAHDISMWMHKLEQFMINAQRIFYSDTFDPGVYRAYYQQYNQLMEALSGKAMNAQQWATTRKILGVPNGTLGKNV